jgi:general transcription factor 3C polypeptide 3 (transcription factor C subunit 4)
VGDALFEIKDYENAIHFYFSVFQGAQIPERKLWYNMATCYKALSQVEDAEDCYKALLQHDPKDTEALMELASIYEVSDRKPEALELVNTVLQIRKEQEVADLLPGATNTPSGSDESAFLPNQPKGDSKVRRAAMTLQEKKDQYNKRTEQALVKWQKLEYLKAAMEAGEPEAVKQWIDTAGELVDDFRNTKALYPLERGKAFLGFVQLAGRRAYARSEKEKLERMKARLQESLTDADDTLEPTPDMKVFRGLDFDTWLYIFMQYALCLTKYEKNHLDAYDVCSAAKEANVFYTDKKKQLTIWATWLACALHVHDSNSVSTICRWFLSTYQFQSEVYELFTGALTASHNGQDVFHSNPNQKFFLRHIKAMDEAIDGEKRVGSAGLSNLDENGNPVVPERIDFSLLMLYGHMLINGKSYISALNYYTRAYHINPSNPMIPFAIGVAYLHRCMQRQCENRHLQALQAFTFLYEYYDLRTEGDSIEKKQEAEYNIGRALQQLGLTHLAVRYYERVIAISEKVQKEGGAIRGDLKWEAAYNLQMVYVTSGNAALARGISEKYLVI